jgi:hypothetical protein
MQANIPASVSLALSAPRAASASRRKSYGRSRSYGRSYSRGRSYGRKGVSYYQKRAIARRAYIRGKYPSATYAHPYVPRGSAAAQALGISPGVTFKDATAEEQVRRRAVGWYGKGDYAMDGMGDYAVVPKFTGRNLQGGVINLGDNKQMIREEIFFNVMAPTQSGQQQILSFPINIGLDEMFPMGSQFANNYRKYRITQLAFTYKTMLSNSQQTTQVGTVSMTFNPDVGEETDIVTNMQVANDQSTVSCLAVESTSLFCEMDPRRGAPNQFLNIRNKDLRVTQDADDYDTGVFILTLAGFPPPVGGSVPAALPYQIGRLSVSYCVELQHEVINTSMGSSIDCDLFLRPGTLVSALPPAVWALDRLLKSENNVGCTLTSDNLNSVLGIQWPSTAFGFYQVEIYFEGIIASGSTFIPSSFLATPPLLFSSNGTVGPVFDLLNTSRATPYVGLWSGSCVAPTGSAIVPPGDPYCYGNGQWAWTPQLAAGGTTAGDEYRLTTMIHCYVPGISSNAPAIVGPSTTNSPIQLFVTFPIATRSAGGSSANSITNGKWMIRISEYNATMRLKLNGTQDQPYTTNFAGQPVLLSAAGW